MAESILLGKAELLAWAASTTGISPCETYGDLKDGLIYLALTQKLFPGDIDSSIVRLQRRGARDAFKNWSLLNSCLQRHGIPTHLCSRQAVERGHTRYCFNLLVLFYFLVRLACGHWFKVDFAQPVDSQLAVFLQSPESVSAVGCRVDVGASSGRGNLSVLALDDDETERRRDASTQLSVTSLLSAPPVATALETSRWAAPSAPPQISAPSSIGGSSNHVASSSCRMSAQGEGGGHSTRASMDAADSQTAGHCRNTYSGDFWPPQSTAYNSTSVHAVLRRPAASGDERATSPLPPASFLLGAPSSTVHLAHLSTQNQLLREELQHVKAVCQLLLTQKRGSEASAAMRASATLHDELAKAAHNHLHDLRQLEVSFTTSAQPDSTSTTPLPRQWADLAQRAKAAEVTAVQLYRKHHESCQVYDFTLQQLRHVFCSVADIAAAAALSSELSTPDHADAVAYELTVTEAMVAQLTGVSSMLKDAFREQLRALLLTLSSLRSANARLQLDAEWVQHHRDTGGVGGDVTWYSSSLHAPSSLRLERECLKTACAEAQGAYKGENPAVQLALRRLSHLIDVISNDVASMQQDRYGWEQRCQRAEAASHQTGAASHGALAGSEAQVQQTSKTHAMPSDVDMAQLSRITQERCARVEQALQESQRFCSQVERVHALAFSTPAAHEMQWAGYELVELLGTHVKAPGPKSAMEEVLAEQAETIAGLRVDLRQQRKARKQVEVRLRDSERQRQLLEHECAAFQDQICSTAKRVDVQKNGSKAFFSSPTAIAMTSNPIPPMVAARSASKQAMTGDSAPGVTSHRVESTPCHSGARVQDSVLHSPGSLCSPITSDDKASGAEECHRFDRTHRRYTTLLHCHAPPSLSPSNSLSSFPSNVVIEEIDGPKALAEQQSFLRRCPAVSVASLIRNTRSWAAPCSKSSGSSLLMSATELERRKQEILHKYDAA